jgi:hypothetical protein
MTMELPPLYQCFKQVRAAQIARIEISKPVNNDLTRIMARTLFFVWFGEGPEIPPVSIPEDVYQKHKPQVGWYLVRYEDGYTSFSPPETFEAGYARIDTPGDGATPLKAAFLAQRAVEATLEKERRDFGAERTRLNDENRTMFTENSRLRARLADLGES